MGNWFSVNARAINLICIFVASILCAVAVIRWRWRKKGEKEEDVDKFLTGVIFTILLLFGVGVRLWGFPDIPYGINQDEVMTAVDAKALSEYGTDRFGTFLPCHLQGWTYSQQSALLAYVTAPFVKLFGLNLFSTRFPILLMSCLGMVAVAIALKKMFGNRAGILGLLLTAINPFLFMQSRWALDCNIYPHVFMIGLTFLMAGLVNDKKWKIYISMLFFGLSMYGYGLSFFFVPIALLLASIYLILIKKIKIKEALLCCGLYFLICWPEYLVMLINYFRLPTISLPFVTIQFFPESIRSSELIFSSENVVNSLKENLKNLFEVLLLQRNQEKWVIFREYGTLYKISFPFVGMGALVSFVRMLKDKQKGYLYGLTNILFVSCVILCICKNKISVSQANIIPYVMILFIVIAIDFLFESLERYAYVVPALYIFMSIFFFSDYFENSYSKISVYMYPNFVDAVEYSKTMDAKAYCITPDTKFPGALQETEILTMFLFDIDSKYWRGENVGQSPYEKPYEETFVYKNPWDYESPNPETVFIFRVDERSESFFPKGKYNISYFGEYGVACQLEEKME